MSIRRRIALLARLIRIDINMTLGHQPSEIAVIAEALFERKAEPGEIMVEAGCWQGGSSAKFSVMCMMQGYRLHVYDSFEGVEAVPEDGWDFSGMYAADQRSVARNISRYGELEVCDLFRGWFADTLAAKPVDSCKIRAVYIDCDLAKGTYEVLQGVLPALAPDGLIFSQDYHIDPVRKLLHDPETWNRLGQDFPVITPLCGNLASIRLRNRA